MTHTALVALGGLLGSVARYWLVGLTTRLHGSPFPLGTLAVNVIGSFVLGLVMVLALEREFIGAHARTFLTIGVCGGFTTMSTFSHETVVLLRDGQAVLAFANVLATTCACFAAIWLGHTIARSL